VRHALKQGFQVLLLIALGAMFAAAGTILGWLVAPSKTEWRLIEHRNLDITSTSALEFDTVKDCSELVVFARLSAMQEEPAVLKVSGSTDGKTDTGIVTLELYGTQWVRQTVPLAYSKIRVKVAASTNAKSAASTKADVLLYCH
jgi:hypothetical protein